MSGNLVFGGIAQLGEHLLCKQGVVGSNPSASTKTGFWLLVLRVALSQGSVEIGHSVLEPAIAGLEWYCLVSLIFVSVNRLVRICACCFCGLV